MDMLEPGGSSQSSLELDILRLSQQWESKKTIRNGDTPGHALNKGPRPALASIPTNVAASASAASNPFSFTSQWQKAVAGKMCQQRQQQQAYAPQQQQQQPTVRFAVDGPRANTCWQHATVTAAAAAAGNAENIARAATPVTALPSTLTRAAATSGGGSGGCSPSPCVLFRGRLSFASEADSARKYDRPPTAIQPAAAAAGASLKRKLLISPGADIGAAFPTLRKPVAKQRRRSLGDVPAPPAGPAAATSPWAWPYLADAATQAGDQAAGEAAAPGNGGAAGVEASFAYYWSDPLPLRQSAAAKPQAAADDDEAMQDTAASPASSSSGGICARSPAARAQAMDACGGSSAGACASSPAPCFSPLVGAVQHALPTVEHPDCGFPSITPVTMRDLLVHGAAAFGLSDVVVVDCRYDYEHAGGRLPGAVHLTTPEALLAFLVQPRPPTYWQTAALVFHCEFSTERGPRAAKFVRNKDREAHLHDYPTLSHPHVFVLQGGYKAFWRAYPELCEGGYTPMDHPDYSQQLKACHNAVKRAWAKTTRTYSRKQRQRRPSYRLRQSTGAGGLPSCDQGEDDAGNTAAVIPAVSPAAEAEPVVAVGGAMAGLAGVPPALVAAQHSLHL